LAPLSLEKALAQIDIRHLANFSFVADTNNLLDKRIAGTILNNWTFGVLGTLQSGRPFPISTGDFFRIKLPGYRRGNEPTAQCLSCGLDSHGLRGRA
jgi:hypothetical protein